GDPVPAGRHRGWGQEAAGQEGGGQGMTPELMEEGTRALDKAKGLPSTGSESGGREAAYGRVVQPGELDVVHGSILYLDDISVSFDGFKALNKLSLNIMAGEMRCII